MDGHWAEFRPGLLKDILGVRVHLRKGAPILLLTATISREELVTVRKTLGRKKEPILIAEGPVKGNGKICVVRRPPSNVDFLGNYNADGTWQPGLLKMLRTLFLDRLVSTVEGGPPYDTFPRTIVFFR